MKKSDIILIIVVLLAALGSWLLFRQLNSVNTVENGVAAVYFNSNKILEIKLKDGTYEIFDDSRIINIDESSFIFQVEGSNPYGVTIKYEDHKVSVIDEESPKHICQTQGATNSVLFPLTCLPNNIIIAIETGEFILPPVDDITS